MTQIDIRGMAFFHGDDGRHPYRTLAIAEAYLPELSITMKDLRLIWSKERGYITQAPAHKGALPLITWFHKSQFARELTDKVVDMFDRMGGELPTPKPVVRRDHVTGKPIGPDAFEDGAAAIAAAKSGAVERRVFPAEWKVAEASEDEATEGLHRVLGFDAVAETMERAGL